MSLSAAMRTAQSSLFNTAFQTGIVSRNISEASNPEYARRSVELTTALNGASVASVRRHSDTFLYYNMVSAHAQSSAQTYLADAGTRLQALINGVDNATSPAKAIGDFENALQLYQANPADAQLATSAVGTAKTLANRLNDASQTLQMYRQDVDTEIAADVDRLNWLLGQFEDANNEVIQATRTGADANDALDQRERILKDISGLIGVSAVDGADNDLKLYTSHGVTLFEKIPRTVSFTPTTAFAPGMTGNELRIDGVPHRPGTGASTDAEGSIGAKLQVRDDLTVTMQAQLDETARGLIIATREIDPSGINPDLAGLFTHPGGPAIPPVGAASTGLALSLSVAAAFDPDVGGDPFLLRDGGANGAAYLANVNGVSGFSERIITVTEALNEPFVTDPAAGITADVSVTNYAETMIGWLEDFRSVSARSADSRGALAERLEMQLNAETGVSMDEEMSLLIELENSYSASARIIQAVEEMYATLLNAV